MTGTIIGILLFLVGFAMLLYGISYVNSPQYRVMSVVYEMLRASDSWGNAAVIGGAILSILGMSLVIVASGTRRTVGRNKNVS